MKKRLQCAFCHGERLDKSMGTYACLNCGYRYRLFTDSKMACLADLVEMGMKGPKDKDEALMLVERINALDEENPCALYLRFLVALKRGFVSHALNYARRAILHLEDDLRAGGDYLPHYFEMLFRRGLQEYMFGMFEKKMRAIAHNPSEKNVRDLVFCSLEAYRIYGTGVSEANLINPDVMVLDFAKNLVDFLYPWMIRAIGNWARRIVRWKKDKDPSKLLTLFQEYFNLKVAMDDVFRYAQLPEAVEQAEDLFKRMEVSMRYLYDSSFENGLSIIDIAFPYYKEVQERFYQAGDIVLELKRQRRFFTSDVETHWKEYQVKVAQEALPGDFLSQWALLTQLGIRFDAREERRIEEKPMLPLLFGSYQRMKGLDRTFLLPEDL